MVEEPCYQHVRCEANRDGRGRDLPIPIKCMSPITQLPLLGPTSRKFHRIPIMPQAVKQAFNTQTFTGCFRYMLKQLPNIGFIKPVTVNTMIAGKGQVEAFAFLKYSLMNQSRFVGLKWKIGKKPRMNYSRKLSTAPRGTPVLLGMIFVNVSEFWVLSSET